MEAAILEILAAIKAGKRPLDAAWLDKLVRRHNRASHDATRRVAKRRLLPYYLGVRANDPERWKSWEVDEETERQLLSLLRMKPRRTASGVATITVITKPWPCSSDCLYCPCDVRMPKSYLHDEPACQRAERNFFDPYLQVRSRLRALAEMGHVTDKVELIVLGGTWSDYPEAYQTWYVAELFRALNEFDTMLDADAHYAQAAGAAAEDRDCFYRSCGLVYDRDELTRRTEHVQQAVNEGTCSYNQAFRMLYEDDSWNRVAAAQRATTEDLLRLQRINETSAHRVVGLCIETRPDLIDVPSLRHMRRLGCTKVQIGIQSLDEQVLAINHRNISVAQIAEAFRLLRLFGFKIHVHAMVNLLGSTAQEDKIDYVRLVSDERFLPDEVKLYPCCLVESSRLGMSYERGDWQPYTEDELLDVLVEDVLATPAYVRISRMIRDISTPDIVAGNKKTNLRQMVEQRVAATRRPVWEIRQREVSLADIDPATLRLDCVRYRSTVSDERFLQWVTPEGRIAGFLRLSLPHDSLCRTAITPKDDSCPLSLGNDARIAMIREVHVYGRVAPLHSGLQGLAQHAGLGRQLIEEACRQARDADYEAIRVISSVGTREYYRGLGFLDGSLYQYRSLMDTPKGLRLHE